MKDIFEFKNRQSEQEIIQAFLKCNNSRLLIIQGEKSVGKSRLVYHALKNWESYCLNKRKKIFTVECSSINNFYEDVKTYLKVDGKFWNTAEKTQITTNLVRPLLLLTTGVSWLIVKVILSFFTMIDFRRYTDSFFIITKKINSLTRKNNVVIFFDNLELVNSDYINNLLIFLKRTSSFVKIITTMSNLEHKDIHVFNRVELKDPKNKILLEKLDSNFIKNIIDEFNAYNNSKIPINENETDLNQLSEICANNIELNEYTNFGNPKTIKLILALYNDQCKKEFIFNVLCELLGVTDLDNDIKKIDKIIKRELKNNFCKAIEFLLSEKSIVIKNKKISLCSEVKNKQTISHNSMIAKLIYGALYSTELNKKSKYTRTNNIRLFQLKILSNNCTVKESQKKIHKLIRSKDIRSLKIIFNSLIISNKLKCINKETRMLSIITFYKYGHYDIMKMILDTFSKSLLEENLFEYRYYNAVYFNYILDKSTAGNYIEKSMNMGNLTSSQKLISFNMKINVYREAPEQYTLSDLSTEYYETLKKISLPMTTAKSKILRQSIDFMDYKNSKRLLHKAKRVKKIDHYEYMNVINCLNLTDLRLMKSKKKLTPIARKLKSISKFAHKNQMHEESYFLNNLSLVYLMQKKYKKALKFLEKAISVNSSSYADFAIIINAVIARVNLNCKDNKINEYMKYINEKLKKLDYKDPTILRKVYTNFAYVYMLKNDKKKFLENVKLARIYSKGTTSDKKLDLMTQKVDEAGGQGLTYQNITIFDSWYIVNSHD